MALLTRMRSGELYALQWSYIDFSSSFISINKSWNKKNGLGPSKSTLNRVVPVSRELYIFLKRLKSESTSPTSLILERFSAWEDGLQAKVLKKFCKSIGITAVRFHDLKATFITQLLLQGVPVAKIIATVANSQLKTTMVYLRMVGNDVKGVTEELKITLPRNENLAKVVSLF